MPEQRRFEWATITAENEEQYIEGGFYPVYFGDIYNDRYVVFRKLGYGTQSTVWLARDRLTNHFVSLKILKAKYSNTSKLEATFSTDALPKHPGKGHVQGKLDFFSLLGPNGHHDCIVVEPMGRSLERIIDTAREIRNDLITNPSPCDPKKWSSRFARELCRQIVLGLDCIHSQGIMHRDIQPGNMMLALTYDLNSMTENQIQRDVWDPKTEEDVSGVAHSSKWATANFKKQHEYINIIKRLGGLPLEENDIKYTVGPVHLHDRLVIDQAPPTPFRVVLTDMGGACRFEDCNDGKVPYPLDIRSPQQILNLPIDEKADIWALGLTLFHIVVLNPLITAYVSWTAPNREDTNDEQLRDMVQRLGPIPEDIRSKWPNADKYVNAAGDMLEPNDEYGPESFWYGDVKHAAEVLKPEDMSDQELEAFVSFIKSMLQWDPSKRPSTSELLRHPWLTASSDTWS